MQISMTELNQLMRLAREVGQASEYQLQVECKTNGTGELYAEANAMLEHCEECLQMYLLLYAGRVVKWNLINKLLFIGCRRRCDTFKNGFHVNIVVLQSANANVSNAKRKMT